MNERATINSPISSRVRWCVWVAVLLGGSGACETSTPMPGVAGGEPVNNGPDRDGETSDESDDAGQDAPAQPSPEADSGHSNSEGPTGHAEAGAALGDAGPEPADDVGDHVICTPPPAAGSSLSKRTLLEAVADCAMLQYCSFHNAAVALQHSVLDYEGDPTDKTLEAARDAWQRAMTVWSRAEFFQFGPAGTRAHDPYHGRGFRDRIYSWPAASRCRVEEQVAGQSYRDGMSDVLVTAKGMTALEYLLFYSGTDTACTGTSSTGVAWTELSSAALAERKRDYALAVADDLVATIVELRDAWDPTSGGFRQLFVAADGYDNPGSGNNQEALNVTAWSFAYLGKEIKDWKVGPFTDKALPAVPVTEFEATHARSSRALVSANLEGFQSLYQGCGGDGDGLGFDDWLVEAGHADLAADIDEALARVTHTLSDFPEFHQASPALLTQLYDEDIKPLSDLIKFELMAGNGSPLNLSLPASAAGDND